VRRRALAPAGLVLLAAAALSACGGGGDDHAAPGSTTTVADAAGTPCALLDIGDISAVTGVAFDRATPGPDQCTYTSSTHRMAVAVDLRSVADAAGQVERDRRSCDARTAVDQAFAGAASGFGCRVAGVPTVVAVGGDGIEVILIARTLDPGSDPERLTGQLATILQHAIAAGGG
jgi:hypothetical protein